MPTDAESHDDVAGLFKRLGRHDSTPQYHDFSPAASAPRAAPPPVPEVAPAAAEAATPAEAAQAAVTAPAEGGGEVAGKAVAEAVLPAADAPATPLSALFARLAAAPLPAAAQSPLARLRQR